MPAHPNATKKELGCDATYKFTWLWYACMFRHTYIYNLVSGDFPNHPRRGFDHDSSKPHNLEKTSEVKSHMRMKSSIFYLNFLIFPGCQLWTPIKTSLITILLSYLLTPGEMKRIAKGLSTVICAAREEVSWAHHSTRQSFRDIISAEDIICN